MANDDEAAIAKAIAVMNLFIVVPLTCNARRYFFAVSPFRGGTTYFLAVSPFRGGTTYFLAVSPSAGAPLTS
jgi:hypothetical protein